MIPRFKPSLGTEELLAAFGRREDAIECFEKTFARTFEAEYALAFPYGRSALWAFFKALGIEGAEIIMPAYTCVVVAHSIVLSKNIPRFVDITLHDYNMDLDQVEAAINEKTRAIIATHLFGYPLNVDRLSEIVRDAEARFGHKIWVVQDCAHAFGAHWQGKLVCNEGDIALFGLNISKMITSVFGGMITTTKPKIYAKLRAFREKNYQPANALKGLKRLAYLIAVYPAFNNSFYSFVYWMQDKTPILDKLTKAYHLDNKVYFPPDYLDHMIALEARVGLEQVKKYAQIVRRRQENAAFYHEKLRVISDLHLPPLVDGATYSHYVLRVDKREPWLDALLKAGVQPGLLIDYSVPDMDNYRQFANIDCVNARQAVQTVLNLPIHVNDKEREVVLSTIKRRHRRMQSRK